MRTMAAGKFKAHCLGVLDEVQVKREPVVVTKNGKAVARVMPMETEEDDPILGFLQGQVGDSWEFVPLSILWPNTSSSTRRSWKL